MAADAVLDGLGGRTLSYRAPGGPRLAEFLDSLCVEKYWLKGHHIVWQTGQQNAPDGVGVASHSHCSAFAAAAAQRLGIYLLRPPVHSEILLASAQGHWLMGYHRFEGPSAVESGWKQVGISGEDGVLRRAVDAATRGKMVVAAYLRPPLEGKSAGEKIFLPGHIAIVRPSTDASTSRTSSVHETVETGAIGSSLNNPFVCTAGHINASMVGMQDAFSAHPGAWPANIHLFEHETPLEHDSPVRLSSIPPAKLEGDPIR